MAQRRWSCHFERSEKSAASGVPWRSGFLVASLLGMTNPSETNWPKNTKTSSPEKEKRLRENGNKSRLPESHVPRLRERVGTKQSRYMIATRLPWRQRARPSATLHEIQS